MTPPLLPRLQQICLLPIFHRTFYSFALEKYSSLARCFEHVYIFYFLETVFLGLLVLGMFAFFVLPIFGFMFIAF